MKEHRYIRRTHKYYTGIILTIVICTFLFLSKKMGYHKTSYKLHIRETRSGRPVIYLLDEISGSVEIVNPNNVEYIEELKKKYDVVVKEWKMTIEELEFLRYFSKNDTIFRLYKQLKKEGKTDQEICDYIEYCDTAASSHEGLELWVYLKN